MKKLKVFTVLMIFLIAVTACGGDDDSSSQEDMEQEQVDVSLDGDYVGAWVSSTSTGASFDVAVSSRLSFSGSDMNRLTGPFFISSNFTVCCSSGDNDGTIIIELDGDTITSFRYNDVITDCSGTFLGEGEIRSSDRALVVNFTGSDCDGEHDGVITLRKI